jgi:hypothetical protein
VSDRRNATGTRTGASGQFKRLLDLEGVEGEGTLPRLIATCSLLSHRPGLVIVRGVKSECPSSRDAYSDEGEPIRS